MGRRRVVMADVAERANVSKMSVSRVINNKPGVSPQTRMRVEAAIEELGYEVSSDFRLSSIASKLIGLLIPDITTAYIGEILRGISNAAEQLNYGLVLYTQGHDLTADRATSYISLLDSGLVDGLLVAVPRDYENILDDLNQRNLSYVIIDHHSRGGEEPSVTATNRKGTLHAMRHLLALQHTRIGFISGRMDIICSYDRLNGYRDGLAEVGLSFDPDLVREGDFQQTTGFRQTMSLLQMDNPPTAILASNDLMAFGAMDAARAMGLSIGTDISIVGFDDIYMASQTYPPLTTVRQPLAEMGEVALDMLIMLLEGRPMLSTHRELPTELIVRESTGRAP